MQLVEHGSEPLAERCRIERRVDRIEPRDEARHVRALLVGRQRNVEVPLRDGRQHGLADAQLDRIAHVFHANALDREAAFVALALRVGDVQRVFQIAHVIH